MKREKGITTIGLVVTIIVMRILEEVTILNKVWEESSGSTEIDVEE